MGNFLGVAAAIACVGAGIYLLTSQSPTDDTTVFVDVLMHGIGIYFIARGAWMLYEMSRA